MKKTITLGMAAIAAVLASCNGNSNSSEVTNNLQPNDSLFKVQEGPYRFSMILPKDLMITDQPQFIMNEATGELEIKLGEGFGLVVSRERRGLAELQSELNEDPVFNNVIVEQADEHIVYQQVLPSGEGYYFNYLGVTSANNDTYMIRTNPQGGFMLEEVTRMKNAAGTITDL